MKSNYLENALGFNIYRAELLIRREFSKALAEYGMTPEQWSVMTVLLESDHALNQRDLNEHTLKDKHTTSRIVKRLERDGWIEKTADTFDGRATRLIPTQRGIRLKNEIPEKLSLHFEPLLAKMNHGEITTLLNLLQKLRTIFGD